MSYRPPAVAPRGRWARFLHQMRRDLDWSQQQGFEQLREGLNLGPKSRASYIAIDMGHRPPTAGEAGFLVKFFGKGPDDVPDVAPDDDPVTRLVAALAEQTKTLTGLLAELRGTEQMEARLRALEAEVRSLREQPTGGGSQGRSVPRARAV